MRISRIFRSEDAAALDEPVPLTRLLMWVLVWVGIAAGLVLYFLYARLLPPLLG